MAKQQVNTYPSSKSEVVLVTRYSIFCEEKVEDIERALESSNTDGNITLTPSDSKKGKTITIPKDSIAFVLPTD